MANAPNQRRTLNEMGVREASARCGFRVGQHVRFVDNAQYVTIYTSKSGLRPLDVHLCVHAGEDLALPVAVHLDAVTLQGKLVSDSMQRNALRVYSQSGKRRRGDYLMSPFQYVLRSRDEHELTAQIVVLEGSKFEPFVLRMTMVDADQQRRIFFGEGFLARDRPSWSRGPDKRRVAAAAALAEPAAAAPPEPPPLSRCSSSLESAVPTELLGGASTPEGEAPPELLELDELLDCMPDDELQSTLRPYFDEMERYTAATPHPRAGSPELAVAAIGTPQLAALEKLVDVAIDPDALRLPEPHHTKYQIMLQTLAPPTDLDQEPHMHAPDQVSATFKLMDRFVATLADKAFENGLGQRGQPGLDDVEALRALAERYELGGLLEKTYKHLNHDMQPLCSRAVAMILAFGPGSLGEPEAVLRAQAAQLTETAFTSTGETRMRAALMMTGFLLEEAVKVAMRPVWRGANSFTNVLDAKDVMIIPALTYPEMIGLPSNPAVDAPVLSRSGKPYAMILVDEVQDSNLGQACLVKWAMTEDTLLVVIGDRLQRCFSFASASTAALDVLVQPRSTGNVQLCQLSNNFRSARLICDEIQRVLREDVGSNRIVRPVRADHGEVLHRANLRHGVMQRYLRDGTLAILARLNCVLAAFKAHFLKVGQPFAVLNKKGVLPHLLRLLDSFHDNTTQAQLLCNLRIMVSNPRGSLEDKDLAICLTIFASSLPSAGAGHATTTFKERLTLLIMRAYAGTAEANNANVRGMPILSNGHSAKGHEFHTVLLAEPKMAMIQNIVDRGGEEADDERHLKYVLVSRARERLVYLEDVFEGEGHKGIAKLCTPLN